MKLTIGEHAGFCFGVRRAVDKAFACAKEGLPLRDPRAADPQSAGGCAP